MGELAKAYIVLRTGVHADEAEIVGFCRQHLAAYKMPRAIQFVPDLPKPALAKSCAGCCAPWSPLSLENRWYAKDSVGEAAPPRTGTGRTEDGPVGCLPANAVVRGCRIGPHRRSCRGGRDSSRPRQESRRQSPLSRDPLPTENELASSLDERFDLLALAREANRQTAGA